ncbi:MAG: UTP--glucose-1-phosphate uridylyltransferase [Parachlamydiales bacterium]|nr:UTP--glucose-1-phosphate uridylyltransferase [Parachlamydiales bacterium]
MKKVFKTKIFKNPLDKIIIKAKKQNKTRFLLLWNRGLGDIALYLHAVVYRIREFIPNSEITFLTRQNLKEGFELLDNVRIIVAPFINRYVPVDVQNSLKLMNIDPDNFDVIIDNLDPNNWVKWQIGKLTPKLNWKSEYDDLSNNFNFPKDKILVAVSPTIETNHSFFRSWPDENFQKLFKNAHKDICFVLLGCDIKPNYLYENVLDLRGKTTFLEVLSIIKNRCQYLISLDSGIQSMFFYINQDFPIKLISLWKTKDLGILKLKVSSPNKKLRHCPLINENGLQYLEVEEVIKNVYPNDIFTTLKNLNQSKVLSFFEKFSIQGKIQFIKSLFSFDFQKLDKQEIDFKSFLKKEAVSKNFQPLEVCEKANKNDFQAGNNLFLSKNIGCIILAGGQGTRLGFDGPKGLFEINGQTLFSHLFSKILKKQKKYGKNFYVSIMTSHLNHEKIIKHFEKENFFGLKQEQVDFFRQDSYPFLDENGDWIFLNNFEILKGPDGNGNVFKNFYQSGLFEKYKIFKNIDQISVVPIDNILNDPFDEELFGFLKNNNLDVLIKCIKRDENQSKQGAICKLNGSIKIVEYLHLDPRQNYYYSNTGIYAVSLKFIEKVINQNLPKYFVLKKIDPEKDIFAYKTETFIFDNFIYSNNIKTLLDDKNNFYFPIKDKISAEKLEKILSLGNRTFV